MRNYLFSTITWSIAPRIEIDVTPFEFTFKSKRSQVTLKAALPTAATRGTRLFTEIAESLEPSVAAPEVHLFAGESAFPTDPDFLMGALVEFLRTGIRSALKGKTLVRPVVTFRGVASLDNRLGGFQGNLLRGAAILAGAVEVIIES